MERAKSHKCSMVTVKKQGIYYNIITIYINVLFPVENINVDHKKNLKQMAKSSKKR
jgi:uncharacterized membrane protein (DUF441 family)